MGWQHAGSCKSFQWYAFQSGSNIENFYPMMSHMMSLRENHGRVENQRSSGHGHAKSLQWCQLTYLHQMFISLHVVILAALKFDADAVSSSCSSKASNENIQADVPQAG